MKFIQMECIRQKAKMIKGSVSVKIDFCIKKGDKDKDIDSFLKLLLDAFNGIVYEDDKDIIELIIRKHNNQSVNQIVVLTQKVE